MKNKVILACDHGGLAIKQEVMDSLASLDLEIVDLGVNDGEIADYPDKAKEACTLFLQGGYLFGILLCGTGIGISIAANKINGIRCALQQNLFTAQMSKEHNNANFIAFGGRIEYKDSIPSMIKTFAQTKFAGGRHQTRLDKISKLEI